MSSLKPDFGVFAGWGAALADFRVHRGRRQLRIEIEGETMSGTSLSRLQKNGEEIVLPIVLVVTGLILVGGDLLGVLSLDGVRNYWPLAVIAIGLTHLNAEPRRAMVSQKEHARQL